jgi:hypothetical protein
LLIAIRSHYDSVEQPATRNKNIVLIDHRQKPNSDRRILNQPAGRFGRETRLNLLNAGHRHGRDAFAPADKTEAFVRGSLNADPL